MPRANNKMGREEGDAKGPHDRDRADRLGAGLASRRARPADGSGARPRRGLRHGDRLARLERVAELRDNGPMDALSDRNPVDLMQRRADLLIQRGTDLKRVADAWQPLYKTLSQDQKKRMAFVTLVGVRAMRDAIEHRNDNDDDDD